MRNDVNECYISDTVLIKIDCFVVYGNWSRFEVGVIVTLLMELSKNNLNKRRVNWKDIVYRYNELCASSLIQEKQCSMISLAVLVKLLW